MNLDDETLVAKYGSWMKVQIAFYDFLFISATSLCPEHCNSLFTNFADGEVVYEKTITDINRVFPNSALAWEAFMKDNEETKT